MVIVAHSLIVKKQTLTNGLRKQYATPISYLQFYFIALGISSSIQTKFARLHFAYPCLQSSASWRQMPGSNGGLVGERRGSRLCKPAFAPREAFQGKRIAEKKKRRERAVHCWLYKTTEDGQRDEYSHAKQWKKKIGKGFVGDSWNCTD